MLAAGFPASIAAGRAIRSPLRNWRAGRRILPREAQATAPIRGLIAGIRSSSRRRSDCARALLFRKLGAGRGGGGAMAWACPRCTYLNRGGGAACGMCALESPEPGEDAGPEWACPTCTFLNPVVESACEMCSTARPELAQLERGSDRPAAKFRPLRACPPSRAEREKSLEIAGGNLPAANDALRLSEDREPDAISRKRKAAAVDEEDGPNVSEMDGLTTRSSAAAAEGDVPTNNRWLGQLHMQRMSRINNSSMASSDAEKKSQQSSGQASGLASESSEPRRLATTGGPCPNLDSDEIVVILTYNVWFNEDLELQARMNAIGKIIQLHQPHVICFQEVTPNIYSIFQRSSWWSLYKCSVGPALVARRAYFCIQLSRLPVSSFHRNPYANSVMGRELAMADLNHGSGEQLVVATTHLESPCPAPPTWNQMFSKERVDQAKEALKLMEDLPNVVFGGDMNWDDKKDGPPPLPPGWFDAWLKYQPSKPGLTYDSKANPMLTGSRLQKRLDRLFCHLRDFKVKSIEFVGTEPIPGLTYEKERKVRGQVQRTTLPVLPSDHFGLILQLQSIRTS